MVLNSEVLREGFLCLQEGKGGEGYFRDALGKFCPLKDKISNFPEKTFQCLEGNVHHPLLLHLWIQHCVYKHISKRWIRLLTFMHSSNLINTLSTISSNVQSYTFTSTSISKYLQLYMSPTFTFRTPSAIKHL